VELQFTHQTSSQYAQHAGYAVILRFEMSQSGPGDTATKASGLYQKFLHGCTILGLHMAVHYWTTARTEPSIATEEGHRIWNDGDCDGCP